MAEHCEALNDMDQIDFLREDNPRCPHCGKTYDVQAHENWDLYDTQEGDHDVECDSCEKAFRVAVRCSFTFSTDEQPEPDEYDV